MAQPASTPPRSPALPPAIGRFRPERVLGRGGQGIVYLAQDPDLGRPVAIKTLTRRAHDIRQLLNEARNVARLEHPNIVALFEIALDQSTPHLVYQFAAGRPLSLLIAGDERIAVKRALEIMIRVLDAIHYAHVQGVLHRDLTPANILVDDADQPRILDFGLSIGAGTANGAGTVAGTPDYMAPEVLANHPPGPGADLWALGVVLHELLSGRRLFQADNPMAAMYKVVNERIRPPSVSAGDIDAALDAIVMKCLDRDPARRYANAAAVRDALTDYLAPAPAPATAGRGQHSGAIEFLQRRMARKPDFPAISRHIAEINQKSGAHEQVHVNDLAAVILKDYALTTKLLRVVNSATYAQYGGSISTVSRAVVILGFEQVRALALGLVIFEHLRNGDQAEALKDAACHSFLSGMLAKEVCLAQQRPSLGEETFIGAMFHQLGRHLAIYYFPDEFREVVALMQAKGVDEAAAAREIFGADFAEFGSAIGREWNLPDGLLAAMQPQRGARLRPATNVTGQIAQVSAFSNEAAAIAGGDPAVLDARLGRLLERYAECVPLTTGSLKAAVASAIDATRAYAAIISVDFDSTPYLKRVAHAVTRNAATERVAGARHPGDTLLEEAAHLAADEVADAGQRRNLFLTNAIAELTTAILERAPVNDMFTMVLEALYRSMDFSHVLFLMRDPKRRAYVTRFGFGDDVEALKARFIYQQDAAEDIFSLAVNKGRNAVIVDATDERYRASVPAWCRELTAPLSILVFAVIVNKVCIGLIYADSCREPLRMNATELKLLNTLVRQLSLGVVQR